MGIVRHSISGARQPAELEPGELVWARIINGLENPRATGKVRPVILVESRGSQWKTMGLTTNPRYRDGSRRVAIPDPNAVGLRAPGWLWGGNLTWVSGIDIEDHIGWIDHALACELIDLASLTGPTARHLVAVADGHDAIPFRVDRSAGRGGAA